MDKEVKELLARFYIKSQFGTDSEFYTIDECEKNDSIKVTKFIKTSDTTCKSETVEDIKWLEGAAWSLREKYRALNKDVRHYVTLNDRIDLAKVPNNWS